MTKIIYIFLILLSYCVFSQESIRYQVKQGDTLYSIAHKFDVGIDDLVKINNLEKHSIEIGQVLVIPDKIFAQKLQDIDTQKANDSELSAGTYFPYYTVKLGKDGKLVKNSKHLPSYTIRIIKEDKKIKFTFFENHKKIKEHDFDFNKKDYYIINDDNTKDKIRIRNYYSNYILVEFFSSDLKYNGGIVMLKSSPS